MSYDHQRIAVTGIGLLTSLGKGVEHTWNSLIDGKSGVSAINRFPIDGLRTTIAATVDDFEGNTEVSCSKRTQLILNEVVDEAFRGASPDAEFAERFKSASVYLAVPGGEVSWTDRALAEERSKSSASNGLAEEDELAAKISEDGLTATRWEILESKYGFRSPPVIVTTACASGATAIQLGCEAIRRGDAKIALAAGADSTVSQEGLIRFSLLSALSRRNEHPQQASRPFDVDREGFVMGEGGAALILEREDAARERGAKIYGFVRGYGDATDNFHRTRSNPSGERIKTCIERALSDAKVTKNEISAVNAHGTSTPENDKMEALGLQLALGERAKCVPISSNKSMIGHTLSAAGIVEAAISLLSLENQALPPSINVDQVDEALQLNVALKTDYDTELKFILSNSFGFGGQNVSLVLERA